MQLAERDGSEEYDDESDDPSAHHHCTGSIQRTDTTLYARVAREDGKIEKKKKKKETRLYLEQDDRVG